MGRQRLKELSDGTFWFVAVVCICVWTEAGLPAMRIVFKQGLAATRRRGTAQQNYNQFKPQATAATAALDRVHRGADFRRTRLRSLVLTGCPGFDKSQAHRGSLLVFSPPTAPKPPSMRMLPETLLPLRFRQDASVLWVLPLAQVIITLIWR
jgi:hypothetical protein